MEKQLEELTMGMSEHTSSVTPVPIVTDKFILPCGPHKTWANIFFSYRLLHQKTGEIVSGIRISIRKYAYRGTVNRWIRKQSYNCNNVNEARALIQFIKGAYPELVDE